MITNIKTVKILGNFRLGIEHDFELDLVELKEKTFNVKGDVIAYFDKGVLTITLDKDRSIANYLRNKGFEIDNTLKVPIFPK